MCSNISFNITEIPSYLVITKSNILILDTRQHPHVGLQSHCTNVIGEDR